MSIANNQNTYLSKRQIDKCKLILSLNDKKKYLESDNSGILRPLLNDGGIVFQNAPSLSFSSSVSYTPYELSHTNYDLNAYQKSSITDFQIQDVKLTSETRDKANYTLAVIQFLRTFSKMSYGINDEDAGMPPSIMYFSAYGEHMFNRVPVVIGSFTIMLDNSVDYVQASNGAQVPMVLTIQIAIKFMPTPSKMKSEFSLTDFANGSLVKKGYI